MIREVKHVQGEVFDHALVVETKGGHHFRITLSPLSWLFGIAGNKHGFIVQVGPIGFVYFAP